MKFNKITIVIITSFLFSYGCKKEFELPMNYSGYALLQTEGTGIDGVVLFTIYSLPDLNDELINRKINYSEFLRNKSLTIITTPIEPYLDIRQEIFDKKWKKAEDVILVKVNYEIKETYWKQYTSTETKEIKLGDENRAIENVIFNSQVNSVGKYLYKLNNLELLEKVN